MPLADSANRWPIRLISVADSPNIRNQLKNSYDLACLQSGCAGGYGNCSLASTFHHLLMVPPLTWHVSIGVYGNVPWQALPSCFHCARSHLPCFQSGPWRRLWKMLLDEHFPSCFYSACAHLRVSRVALQEAMENVFWRMRTQT